MPAITEDTRAKILLVDDRPENLLALSAVLARPDYDLVEANSGEEALKQILIHDFAAILLDVQMPGLDGFETAMLIKKREKSQEIPIIFITAVHKDELFSAKGYEVGGVDYVFKPFDPSTLRSKVAVFVSMYKKNRQQQKQLLDQEVRNLTHGKKIAELELETAARFQILAEAIPQMVWTADASGAIDYCNQRWYQYTGLTPAASHQMAALTHVVHADDVKRSTEAWQKATSEGVPYEIEQRLKHQDGSFHWHLTRATPMRDPYGKIVKWFGTSTNIDEQKRSEAHLFNAVRSRDELLAVVSHDLKNPISAIRLCTELAQRVPSSDPILSISKQIERIHSSAERANRLVHDLLQLAQMEAGHLTIQRRQENLSALLDEVVDMLSPQAEEKKVVLQNESKDTDVLAECDRERIHQVLSNLIGNAIKFTPQSGVVTTKVWTSKDEIHCEIGDTGPGIPQDQIKHLFERYWQASKTRNSTGLGLYISRGIIESHGGKIRVESHVGTGSRFGFSLPKKVAGN